MRWKGSEPDLAMDPPALEQRLSQITTQWSLLFAAHVDGREAGQQALAVLAQRYCSAAFRYLLAAVRDPDVAADLAQEFALRILQGDFRNAHPQRGRFRSYLKTALFNIVADYRRRQKSRPRGLPMDLPDPESGTDESHDHEGVFLDGWREVVIERTWKALLDYNATYHAALQLRVANPEMTSAEMAERISTQLSRPLNGAAARKALQRGHEKFADLLMSEIAKTLENPELPDIEDELRALDLLRYCKSAVERRRQRGIEGRRL